MTTKTFLIFAAAIGAIYGAGFILLPNVVADIYGLQITPASILGFRYFGVALLGWGLMCWSIKDLRDPIMLRNALIGHAVSDVAGIVVSATATAAGTINALGWMNVALYVAMLAACVFLSRGLSTVGVRLAA